MELFFVPFVFVLAGLVLAGFQNGPRAVRWVGRALGLSGFVEGLVGERDAAGVLTQAEREGDLLVGGRAVERWRIQRWGPVEPAHPQGVLLDKVRELRIAPGAGHPGYRRAHAEGPHRALVERLGARLVRWTDDQLSLQVPADGSDLEERVAGARLLLLDQLLAGRADAAWAWLAEPQGRSADARAVVLLEEAADLPAGQAAAQRLADHPAPRLRALAALARSDVPALAAVATGALARPLLARVVRALVAARPPGLGGVLREVSLTDRAVREAVLAGVAAVPDAEAPTLLTRLWRAAEPDEWPALLHALVAQGAGLAQAWDALAADDGRIRQAGGDGLWRLLGDGAEAAAFERLAAGGAVSLGLCEALSRHGTVAAVPHLEALRAFDGPEAQAAGWAIADIQDRAAGAPGGLALAADEGRLALVEGRPEPPAPVEVEG